jgi:hypothetical protein
MVLELRGISRNKTPGKPDKRRTSGIGLEGKRRRGAAKARRHLGCTAVRRGRSKYETGTAQLYRRGSPRQENTGIFLLGGNTRPESVRLPGRERPAALALRRDAAAGRRSRLEYLALILAGEAGGSEDQANYERYGRKKLSAKWK